MEKYNEFEIVTVNETLFQDEVEEKEKTTFRLFKQRNELSFIPLWQFLKGSESLEGNPTKDVLDDYQENLGIVCRVICDNDIKNYLVNDAAYASLKGRLDIKGPGLDQIGKTCLCEICNHSMTSAISLNDEDRYLKAKEEEKVLLIISDNVITGFMSPLYEILSEKDVLQDTLDYLVNEQRLTPLFKSGRIDHYMMEASYWLDNQFDSPVIDTTFRAGFKLKTSNNGHASTSIEPFIRKVNTGADLILPGFQMRHRGKANTKEELDKIFPEVFALLQDFNDKLDALATSHLIIQNPGSVMMRACDTIFKGVAGVKKVVERMKMSFAEEFAKQQMNANGDIEFELSKTGEILFEDNIEAYDLVMSIVDAQTFCAVNAKGVAKESALASVGAAASKVLNLDFAKLDAMPLKRFNISEE